MKNKTNQLKKYAALLLMTALCVSMCACSSSDTEEEAVSFYVTASFYPVYAMTCAVADGVKGVSVERLECSTAGDFNKYSVTENDRKRLDITDVFVINGGGLESFLSEVSVRSIVDAVKDINMRESLSDDMKYNPYLWTMPSGAYRMCENIALGLSERDPDNAAAYESNLRIIGERMNTLVSRYRNELKNYKGTKAALLCESTYFIAEEFEVCACLKPEPSAEEILKFEEEVKNAEAELILCDGNYPAESAEEISERCGCKLCCVNSMTVPPEESGENIFDDFAGIYEDNLSALKTALEK